MIQTKDMDNLYAILVAVFEAPGMHLARGLRLTICTKEESGEESGT